MFDKIVEDGRRKIGREICLAEEQPARFVLHRQGVGPAVCQVGGDHAQVDGARFSLWDRGRQRALHRSPGRIPQVLESQRLIERFVAGALYALVQPFDQRLRPGRRGFIAEAGTNSKSVVDKATHKVEVDDYPDENGCQHQGAGQGREQELPEQGPRETEMREPPSDYADR